VNVKFSNDISYGEFSHSICSAARSVTSSGVETFSVLRLKFLITDLKKLNLFHNSIL
jgi:hypothetical protein